MGRRGCVVRLGTQWETWILFGLLRYLPMQLEISRYPLLCLFGRPDVRNDSLLSLPWWNVMTAFAVYFPTIRDSLFIPMRTLIYAVFCVPQNAVVESCIDFWRCHAGTANRDESWSSFDDFYSRRVLCAFVSNFSWKKVILLEKLNRNHVKIIFLDSIVYKKNDTEVYSAGHDRVYAYRYSMLIFSNKT